jgi:hypothetical protein
LGDNVRAASRRLRARASQRVRTRGTLGNVLIERKLMAAQNVASQLKHAGETGSRYGLVIVLSWIGFGKYVTMEARVLIEHSPLMSWVLHVFGFSTVARGIGTMEIVAALHHRGETAVAAGLPRSDPAPYVGTRADTRVAHATPSLQVAQEIQ